MEAEASTAVQDATAVGPVVAVLQVTVWPPDELAVQTPPVAVTQPVSGVWHVIVCPPVGPDGVQEEAFTHPVSAVWHVSGATQVATLPQLALLLQSTAEAPPVQL